MESQEIKVLRDTQPKYIVRSFRNLLEIEETANALWAKYEIESLAVNSSGFYIVVFSRNDY